MTLYCICLVEVQL